MLRARSAAILVALSVGAACASRQPAKQPAGDAPTRTTVVLVPDEGGTTGRVRVITPSGSVELAAPFQATRAVAGQPPGPPERISEADVQREFGDAIAALPPPAEHFVL